MKVLITGSKGQLGKELSRFLLDKAEVVGVNREELDITNGDAVSLYIDQLRPEIILHCAAYTNVDEAEKNHKAAYGVNVDATQCIAKAAMNSGSTMVYISTDYVFDGEKRSPYSEEDRPNPMNYYGLTKLRGEQVIQACCKKFHIIRTSWLYSNHGNNFINTMLKLAQNHNSLNVVNDQTGAPTFVPDLVQMLWEVICKKEYGIYHISNKGETSWFDFAKKIFELSKLPMEVLPITSEQLGRAARRPTYSVLGTEKLERSIDCSVRVWDKALMECIEIRGKEVKI